MRSSSSSFHGNGERETERLITESEKKRVWVYHEKRGEREVVKAKVFDFFLGLFNSFFSMYFSEMDTIVSRMLNYAL